MNNNYDFLIIFILFVETPTENSIEVAVAFLKECDNEHTQECLNYAQKLMFYLGILKFWDKIAHSFLMAKEEPPICTDCGIQVTLLINHILTECRIYHSIRNSSNLAESLAEILDNVP